MELIRGNWTINSSEVKYDNPWIKVTEHQVINPSGNNGIYGEVHFKNIAIGIVALDDQDNIYMVNQFRFVLNQESLEIPEGGGSLEIDPLLSAKRELKEETGLVANSWEKLMELHLSNSVSNEKAIIYLAKDLHQDEMDLEETEDIVVSKLSLKEAYKLVNEHKITDAISVAAILKLYILQFENKR
jgi:8-oxo-dGTP pyrophosphatase MutT (NUDIX family)